MLVTTSFNDSQVMYWEPAKYVAKLRTLKTDKNPLLLKTKMEPAGHGGASRPLRRPARPRLRARLDAEAGRDHEVDRPEAPSAPHRSPWTRARPARAPSSSTRPGPQRAVGQQEFTQHFPEAG